MNAAKHEEPGRAIGETRLLGDLLHAGQAQGPMSEEDWAGLVRSIAARDQRAFHALYERSHRIVFTLVVRIVRNRATAEEVTLDVFHDVWRRAGTYEPAGGSVVGWIMNQARSRAIDRLRFEARKKRTDDSEHRPLPATPVRDPREILEARERERLVREALHVLTADERHAIATAYFSELSYQEVATKLQQPLGTVKTRIRSGLAKLRQVLAGRLSES